MIKKLKYVLCFIVCLLFIINIHSEAASIESRYNTENLRAMNVDNSYNSVCSYISVLNKGESTNIEICDFNAQKNNFKIEDFKILIDTEDVIKITDSTATFDEIGKVNMKIEAVNIGIANITIEKKESRISYTIIVQGDKQEKFNGYVVEEKNTFFVYDSNFENQLNDEIREKAWKIAINSKEYKEEFLGTAIDDEEDTNTGDIDDDEGAVTPNTDESTNKDDEYEESNENVDESLEQKGDKEKQDVVDKGQAPTEIPKAGDMYIMIMFLIFILLTIVVFIIINMVKNR